jgi:hypothetical protein
LDYGGRVTHLHHPQLSGLGRNPAAPEDVLVRLARHGAGRHGISLRRGRLPDPVVGVLLEHGDRYTTVGLHGDRVSPAMRQRIGEHPDRAIRDAYADFIRGMVDRQVSMDIVGIEDGYGEPRTSLINALDPKVRAAVARAWLDRPLAAQVQLLADPDPLVRAAATEREQPGVPSQWWDRCLADAATRANVSRYVPLTFEQAMELLRSGDMEVCQAVAGNPSLPAEAVGLLADIDDPVVQLTVAQSRHVDAETRDRLYALVEAERAAGNVEADFALNWISAEPAWLRKAPLDVRMAYLDCPHVVFRRVLASCRDLPAEAWQRLDNDPDVRVRRNAARRPDAPPAVLEKLVRTDGDVFHIRPLLVEHPNFPRHRLQTFVDEPNPHTRYVALQDPELPVEALQQLAAAPEAMLRRGVARHPNVTEGLLEQLLTDPDPEVADDAAANPVLPPPRMYCILVDAHL